MTVVLEAPAVSIPEPRSPLTLVPRLPIECINVLGVPISAMTSSEALDEVHSMLSGGDSKRLVFMNAACANIAVTDRSYRDVVVDSDLVLNDGFGLDIAAKLQGRRFPANLNGTDLVPQILRVAADRGKRVFLLGGAAGVAEAAQGNLQNEISGLTIVGTAHGFVRPGVAMDALVERIRNLNVDLLIVGMGVPTQELWLDQYLNRTGAQLGVAVGAFIDFAAGRVSRAPKWVRQINLEWAFRLVNEPSRLFRRYVVGNPLFIARLLACRCSDSGSTQA